MNLRSQRERRKKMLISASNPFFTFTTAEPS
jgi:hypothetical protein